MASLTYEVVDTIQSMKSGKTTDKGFSLCSMTVIIPVTSVTSCTHTHTKKNSVNIVMCYGSYIPAVGMRLDVFTRLEKVGALRDIEEATTIAAISVMWSS